MLPMAIAWMLSKELSVISRLFKLVKPSSVKSSGVHSRFAKQFARSAKCVRVSPSLKDGSIVQASSVK